MVKSLLLSIHVPRHIMKIMSALIASILIGMAAPLTVFLPFTPVPITLQVHLVFLLAAVFGPYYSLIMVGSFLMQGFMGLPVFAGGHPASLLTPSLGYLIGYLFAARYLGYAFHAQTNDYLRSFFYFSMANIIVYAFGVCYLQMFIGPHKALLYGVLPFLFPDIIKNMLLARFIHPLQRIYETAF